jgi:hypothetical protein
MVKAEKVGEAMNRSKRGGLNRRKTVEEVLGSAIGGIADERLGGNDEPGFTS